MPKLTTMESLQRQIANLQAQMEAVKEEEQVNVTLRQTDKTIQEIIGVATSKGWNEQLLNMPLAEVIKRATGKTGKAAKSRGSRVTKEQSDSARFHALAFCEAHAEGVTSTQIREHLQSEMAAVTWDSQRVNNILKPLSAEDSSSLLKVIKKDRPNPSVYKITGNGKKWIKENAA